MATIEEAFQAASKAHQAGDYRQAEQLYRQILQAQPTHADATHFLGILACQSNQADAGLELIRRSISMAPGNVGYYANFGTFCQRLGRFNDAAAAYRAALILKSDSAELMVSLADVCFLLDDMEAAETHCIAALRLQPDNAVAWGIRGNIRRRSGQLEEAVSFFNKSLQCNPRFAASHNNLACVLLMQQKMKEATASFRAALAITPDYADAHSNLAVLLQSEGKLDEAEAHLRASVRLNPGRAGALMNLGGVLQLEGKLDDAIESFRAADKLAPRDSAHLSNLLLCLNYDPRVDAPTLFAEHLRWGDRFGKAPAAAQARSRDRNPDRPLRIGYFSPNLNLHPVAHFFEPILRNHDARQVEAICYADVMAPDETTLRLKSQAHGWRDIFCRAEAETFDQIVEDKIDILVDLAGHTAKGRLGLFSRKPAPVQVNYLGYPFTSGIKAMDYRLTDAIADPPGEPKFYTEELFRLPGCFCTFGKPDNAPDVGPLPAARSGHVTFGSLHILLRLNHGVLETWCELLRAVPDSRLLIFRDQLRGTLRDNIFRFITGRGIAGHRIDLEYEVKGSGGYLGVYNDVDISLDTFPWSGHTTSCQALWMGVPVITLRGDRHAGRMVASVLHQIGHPQWVGESRSQYVEIAAKLARDVNALAAQRARLRDEVAASGLCDAAGFTRNLEAAYRQIWRKWCQTAR